MVSTIFIRISKIDVTLPPLPKKKVKKYQPRPFSSNKHLLSTFNVSFSVLGT